MPRKPNDKLLPYMAYDREMPHEGAVLVFARNNREAKKLAARKCMGWFFEEYTDIAVNRLREHIDYLYTLADAEKLAKGEPHVVTDPPSCKQCGRWDIPLDENGVCEECREDEEEVESPKSGIFPVVLEGTKELVGYRFQREEGRWAMLCRVPEEVLKDEFVWVVKWGKDEETEGAVKFSERGFDSLVIAYALLTGAEVIRVQKRGEDIALTLFSRSSEEETVS